MDCGDEGARDFSPFLPKFWSPSTSGNQHTTTVASQGYGVQKEWANDGRDVLAILLLYCTLTTKRKK